jgi:LCP family protein required for cell wall assembly
MDGSRQKRPALKTQRQTIKIATGNSVSVPRAVSKLPSNSHHTPQSIKQLGQHILSIANIKNLYVETPSVTVLARHIPMDMSLPGMPSSMRPIELSGGQRWHKLQRATTWAVALLLTIALTGSGLLFSQSYLKLHQIFRGTAGTAAALKPNLNANALKGETSGRVNVLLLGRDGGDRNNSNITNSIMLASIDVVNDSETLISLPSSLWVNVNNIGVMKLSAVWQSGATKYLGREPAGTLSTGTITAGFTAIDNTVSQILGVHVDYNVLINFQAFKQAVNTVNGISLTVPTTLNDPTMAWQNDNNPVLAQAGVQNLNGQQALNYVMSKETTSDFARDQRQRAVLIALEQKIETLGVLSNPLKISSLIDAFGDNIQTDMSLSNASRLYGFIRRVSMSSIVSTDFVTSPNQYVMPGNISGQAIVLPSAGLFNYSAIQTYVKSILKNPYLLHDKAKVLILNGTTMPGLAATVASQLEKSGINVVGVGNAPSSSWPNTSLIDLAHKSDIYTEHYLEGEFKVTATKRLPDNVVPNSANFVIIIGNNETHTFQTKAS